MNGMMLSMAPLCTRDSEVKLMMKHAPGWVLNQQPSYQKPIMLQLDYCDQNEGQIKVKVKTIGPLFNFII